MIPTGKNSPYLYKHNSICVSQLYAFEDTEDHLFSSNFAHDWLWIPTIIILSQPSWQKSLSCFITPTTFSTSHFQLKHILEEEAMISGVNKIIAKAFFALFFKKNNNCPDSDTSKKYYVHYLRKKDSKLRISFLKVNLGLKVT